MPRKSQSLPPGTDIENYTIDSVLGSGGFGITYKGHDENLGCDVAIKEYFPQQYAHRNLTTSDIEPTNSSDTESYVDGLERFLGEARILARFKHPNIIRVNRFLKANNTGYIIMDYEEGISLQQFLETAKMLSEKQLRQVAIPVMRGLQTLHHHHYLHRDIKPANIYLRRTGSPVLLDFGSSKNALKQQTPGTLAVSEGYAPYEQYRRDALQGPWTDIYALGATLYQCISGRKPVDALRRHKTIQKGEQDPLIPAAQMGKGFYQESILDCIDTMLSMDSQSRPAVLEQLISVFMSWEDPDHTLSAEEIDRSILVASSDHTWDDDVITMIESQLTRFAGPLAKDLVKKALSEAKSIAELLDALCHTIDDPLSRQDFYAEIIGKIAATDTDYLSTRRPQTVISQLAFREQLSQDFLQTAEQRLCLHIGPLSGLLLKMTLNQVNDVTSLIETLAREIPSREDQLMFINDLQLQHAISTTGY